MDALDCIRTRRSIRKYLDKPVEFDKLTLILDAARHAPSVGNLQDYRFILITEKETIQKIAKHCMEQYWIAQAPALIIVCAYDERTELHYGLRGKRLYAIQDSAAAAENILLAANALDLGACWIGIFDEDYLNELLSINEKARPQAIISIGYPDEVPHEKKMEEMETLVFFNTFENKIKNIHMFLKDYSIILEKLNKRAKEETAKGFEKIKHHAKKLHEKIKGKKYP